MAVLDYENFKELIIRDFENQTAGLEVELSKILTEKFDKLKMNPTKLHMAVKDAVQIAMRDIKADTVDKINLTEWIDTDPKNLASSLRNYQQTLEKEMGGIREAVAKNWKTLPELKDAAKQSAEDYVGAFQTALQRGLKLDDFGLDKTSLNKLKTEVTDIGIVTKTTVNNINGYLSQIGVGVNAEKVLATVKNQFKEEDYSRLLNSDAVKTGAEIIGKSFDEISQKAKEVRADIEALGTAYANATAPANQFAEANQSVLESFGKIGNIGDAKDKIGEYADELGRAKDKLNEVGSGTATGDGTPVTPPIIQAQDDMRQASTETADVVVNNNRREAESFGEVVSEAQNTRNALLDVAEEIKNMWRYATQISRPRSLDPQVYEWMKQSGEDMTGKQTTIDAQNEFHQELSKFTANESAGLGQLKEKSEELKSSLSEVNKVVRQISTDASMQTLEYGTEEYNKAILETANNINRMHEQDKLGTIEGITEMRKLINLYKIYDEISKTPSGDPESWNKKSLSERINAFAQYGLGSINENWRQGPVLTAFADSISDVMRSVDTGNFLPLREVVADIVDYKSKINGFTGANGLKEDLRTANELKSVIGYIEAHLKEIQAFNQSGTQTGIDAEAQKLQQQVDILRKAFTSLDTHQTSSKSLFQWISENCTDAEKSLMGVSVNLEEFQKVLRGIEFNSGQTFSFATTLGLDTVNWNELTKAEQELEKFYDLIGDQPFRQWEKEGNPLSQIYHGLADDVRNGLKDAETAIKEFNAEKEKLTQTVAVDQNTANMEGQVTNQVQQHTEAQKQLNEEMREGQQIQQEAATKPAVEVNEYTALTKQLNEVLTLVASINTLIKRNRSTIGESAKEQAEAFKGLYEALNQVNDMLMNIGSKKISINIGSLKDVQIKKLNEALQAFDGTLNKINNKSISINLSGLKDVDDDNFQRRIETLATALKDLPQTKISINLQNLKDIDDLESKLKAVKENLGELKDKQISVRLDGLKDITESDITNKLNSLKEVLSAFPDNLKSIDLKGISSLNELLKMDVDPDALATKFDKLANAVGDFATKLQNIPSLNNSSFLSSINNLIDNGEKLANLATLIKAKQSEVAQAQNILNGGGTSGATQSKQLKSIEAVTKALEAERAEIDKLVDAYSKIEDNAGLIDISERLQQSTDRVKELEQKLYDLQLPKVADYTNATKQFKEYYRIKLKGDEATQDEIDKVNQLESEWEHLASKVDEVTRKLQDQGKSIQTLTNFTQAYANRTGSGLTDYIQNYIKSEAGFDPQKFLGNILDSKEQNKYIPNVIKDAENLKAALSKDSIKNLIDSGEHDKITKIIEDLKNLHKTATSMDGKLAKPIRVTGLMDEISKYMKTFSGLSQDTRNQLKELFNELNNQKGITSISRFNQISSEFNRIKTEAREAGEETKSFFSKMGAQIEHLNAQAFAMYLSWQDIIRYIRQAASAVIELDSALTELRKVSDASTERLQQSFETSANTAKELGNTVTNVINSTSSWARMGYNIGDAEELARITTLYQNVGDGISQEDASESLISTLQGYRMAAEDAEGIIDVFNEVGNRFAITSGGIGESLKRSAAAFNVANTDLQKSVALIAGTNEVVQDVDAIGAMWTTVSARIRGAKTELENLGEDTDSYVESTSKLRDLVKGIAGVDIMENETTFKDIYTIVTQIAEKWDSINDIDQANNNCLYVQKCA